MSQTNDPTSSSSKSSSSSSKSSSSSNPIRSIVQRTPPTYPNLGSYPPTGNTNTNNNTNSSSHPQTQLAIISRRRKIDLSGLSHNKNPPKILNKKDKSDKQELDESLALQHSSPSRKRVLSTMSQENVTPPDQKEKSSEPEIKKLRKNTHTVSESSIVKDTTESIDTVINDINQDEDSKQTELVTKDQDDDVNMFIKEDSISPLQLTVTQNSTNIMIDSSQSSRMLSQQAPYNDQSNDLDRVSLKLQRRKN